MRSYSVIAIILLLLSSPVLAQQVTITVSKVTTSTIDVSPDRLFRGQTAYNAPAQLQPFVYTFSSPQFVSKIILHTKGYNCYFYCYTYTQLCMQVDNDYATRQCKTPPNNYVDLDLVFTFSPARNINSITVTVGGQYPQYASYQLKSFTLDSGTGPATITTNLLELRGSEPKDFGAIRTRTDPGTYTGKYLISSSNPKALAWFGDPFDPRSVDRKETPSPDDLILACLDSDQNGKCDFTDEEGCITRTPPQDWYKGDCCGDAPFNPIAETPSSECVWYGTKNNIVKNAVCGKDADSVWKWAPLEDVGIVVTLSGSCPSMQIVSDSAKFHTCTTGTQTLIPANLITQLTGKITIAGHEYVCQGETIMECGGETPYSETAKKTGDSITHNNQKNYCTDTGKWAVSLDAAGQKSCAAAGLKWTGTKCCGETDDPLKTYEDEYTGTGTAGSCYNNNFIASGSFFAGDKSIINHRGKFAICDPARQPATSATTTNPLLPGLTPTAYGPCGTPLQQAILTGTSQHIICTPDGEWKFTSRTEEHLVKQTIWQPSETEQKKGCCPDDQCWDGQQCRNIGYYYDKIAGKGYRCE